MATLRAPSVRSPPKKWCKASTVPLSTAYRNLAEMCDAGVVVRVGGADRTDRFEMAESLLSHHHHHLVCTECGVVDDFDPSPALERLIAKEMADAAGFSGFRRVTSPVRCSRRVPGVCVSASRHTPAATWWDGAVTTGAEGAAGLTYSHSTGMA